jgi:hypothetical protein
MIVYETGPRMNPIMNEMRIPSTAWAYDAPVEWPTLATIPRMRAKRALVMVPAR